ncbi:MAG: BlaI/MecI/CopY family transcriptional regulator [Fuerstiella sp.]
MKKKQQKKPALSPLENAMMQVLWSRPQLTAEDVRLALVGRHELKDSTVRTVLRRLEEKGFVEHDLNGRTYVYRPTVAQQNVASDAVRGIIDRFCSGSVENLLVGLVDDKMITPEKLRELADQIATAEAKQKTAKKRKK